MANIRVYFEFRMLVRDCIAFYFEITKFNHAMQLRGIE